MQSDLTVNLEGIRHAISEQGSIGHFLRYISWVGRVFKLTSDGNIQFTIDRYFNSFFKINNSIIELQHTEMVNFLNAIHSTPENQDLDNQKLYEFVSQNIQILDRGFNHLNINNLLQQEYNAKLALEPTLQKLQSSITTLHEKAHIYDISQ